MNHRQPALADRVKWAFFAVIGLCVLSVLWTDERFWLNPADPHWKHIAPVKDLLIFTASPESPRSAPGRSRCRAKSAG